MIEDLLQGALAAHQAGDLAAAEAGYSAVLAERPDQADALALLALVREARGAPQEALALLNQAVALDPNAALFRLYQGNVRMAAGDLVGAADSFRAAMALQPGRPEFAYNLGNALRLSGAWDDAEQAYAQALRLAPDHVQARNNLALTYEHQGKIPQAVAELLHATATAPDYFEGWLNLCNLAEKNGDFELAFQAGLKSIALAPQNPSAWFGLGVALNRLQRDEEALSAYQEALRLKPEWPEVWDNLGQTYQFLNRLDEAEQAFRKTVETAGQAIESEDGRFVEETEYGNRHWHLALLELLKGDYRRGFARYRARFMDVGGLARPSWPPPLWRGEDLAGKTILVTDEQGLGDCLMFARYLPMLKAKGARVQFLVHQALIPLFDGWPGADQIIPRGATVSGFDYYASIFDLPFVFDTTLETVPAHSHYLPRLAPDDDTRLPATDKRKIGVVWAGAPLHKHDNRRSVPLEIFSRLFKAEGCQFYSFNRDKREGDENILAAHPVIDLAPRLRHFGDTARLMGQMDLVITCDTSTAHLAGGLGQKVWTLLPFAPDWRWLTEREDSPWYPTMRLFRQKTRGDWADVIARVRESLFF